MEELKYVIEDSTIAELLGVQNFTNDEAAILELVKNAYDAKALVLKISFHGDTLTVFDDGIGMDKDDIKQHWMHIGKSSKEYEVIDSNNKIRIQAGSKGVGRFALSRLGKNIELVSKKAKEPAVVWKTDWNKSILDACNPNFSQGTCITICCLREKWSQKRIKNLVKYLERTYNDCAMKIEVHSEEVNEIVPLHFPASKPGINCRSNIVLEYKDGILHTEIHSDEFLDEAKEWCKDIDFKNYVIDTDILAELEGHPLQEIEGESLNDKVKAIGSFSANLFFNMSTSKLDNEKFLYKYSDTPESVEAGIILYRNAFSISSYEGNKDWLGLGKRSRKSPAAASHPTGSWRVRENQIAGSVFIDKRQNSVLKDMANRQGLDENSYYLIFVEIILTGIKEFERYRQGIIRKINNKNVEEEEKPKPVTERVINNPSEVKNLTFSEVKQLKEELTVYKKEEKQAKREKKTVEERYKYDVRILNVLATTGLKASSIAHELINDRNSLFEFYDNVVEALKQYDMWEELNSAENTDEIYRNVPYLLKSNQRVSTKLVVFMDTMLAEIEKRQFEVKNHNIRELVESIKNTWERDYAWISIGIDIDPYLEYMISEDILQVIFDNLILNSVQQNDNKNQINIDIRIKLSGGDLSILYKDSGKGLDKKYIDNPFKILEVHETTRKDGHGLGMWIINNTVVMSGGEIQRISGIDGFEIEFVIGGKRE